MPSNQAAWIKEKQGKPLVVDEAPYTPPEANEVKIKNGAVAVNPVDWKIQDIGFFIDQYPNIQGCDVSGEIVEVGSGVSNFKVGQRVLGHCTSLLDKKSANAGFQLYTNVPATLVAPIPSSMSFAEATVLPLGVSTAAAGLYQKDYLNLTHPSLSPKPANAAVVVWGGSSSVGACAVQLLKHSGYEVYTTASKHNLDFVKSLGADHVFDHGSRGVVDEIVKALKGKTVAGLYDSIALEPTVKSCVAISQQVGGNKFIATTLAGSDKYNSDESITVKAVFAVTILHNEVGPAIYKDFLPEALAQGKFLAKPDPLVVGQGLESVQAGYDAQRKGVSAKKVVITL